MGEEWWRIGWAITENMDVNDVIEALAEKADYDWRNAVERGEVPNEDVPPGDGLRLLIKKRA